MSVQLLKDFNDNRCWGRIEKEECINFLNKQENFSKILLLAIKNKKDFSWRAAWLIVRVLKLNDIRLSPFVFRIIRSIPEKRDGHQRELLKMVSKFNLSKKQEGVYFDVCMNIWLDIKKKSGTRYYAILFLLKISKKYPEIRNELDYLLEDYYTKMLSPGIKQSVLNKVK
mgnify:CR=1 FL=1